MEVKLFAWMKLNKIAKPKPNKNNKMKIKEETKNLNLNKMGKTK